MQFDRKNAEEKILIVAPYVSRFDVKSGDLRFFTIWTLHL